MTSSVFPDINVWLAMAFTAHAHHKSAKKWFNSLRDEEELIFCRFTQLGLLSLLTLSSVMGNRVKTQQQAWLVYDAFVEDGNARLVQETRSLDRSFRHIATLGSASPQSWENSYLAAFAEEAAMVLVTFDKSLARRAPGSILLTV